MNPETVINPLHQFPDIDTFGLIILVGLGLSISIGLISWYLDRSTK